jgi:SAM-dependent methyltransferase
VQALSIHAWLRWDVVQRLLPRDAANVLEVGAGLGSMGALLAERVSYVGLEPDPESQAEADRRTHGKVLRERAEDHTDVYDLVCAFEVLEHIEDDVAALDSWRKSSRKWLLLSVPLNPDRFGPTDELAGHFRRYTAESLSAKLVEGGWTPWAIHAYGFPAGYALEAIRDQGASRRMRAKTMHERTEASGRWLQPPGSISYLTWAAALPFRGLQRPFAHSALGTGLVALAMKA